MDRKRLQKIIIPLLLEQLLTVSVGMIDTFMVSTVGEAAVSGVALVDNINLLVIQVMAAFAAGGIVVISQYIGNKNEKMSLKSCAQLEVLMVLFSVAAILIWPLSYTLPNALRGAGDVKFSMMISIISMWFGRVAVSYVLVVMFHMGVLGVWLGMFTDWYIRGISYLLRFCSKKWLDKHIFAGD